MIYEWDLCYYATRFMTYAPRIGLLSENALVKDDLSLKTHSYTFSNKKALVLKLVQVKILGDMVQTKELILISTSFGIFFFFFL